MSQLEKIARANEFVRRNEEILKSVKKLLNEYEHNHECAKNLYKKAQAPFEYIPKGYTDGSYPYYNFTTDY